MDDYSPLADIHRKEQEAITDSLVQPQDLSSFDADVVVLVSKLRLFFNLPPTRIGRLLTIIGAELTYPM